MARLLYIGASLLAAAALFWALTGLGALSWLAGPIILLAAAGFTLLALAARDVPAPARTWVYAGAAIGIAVHLLFVIAFVGSLPLSVKGDPGTGVNQDPPAALVTMQQTLGVWIGFATAAAIVIALAPLWTMRERAIGAAGVALLVIVQGLSLGGYGGDTDAVRYSLVAMYALGFLAVAAAAALPLVDRERAPPIWGPSV